MTVLVTGGTGAIGSNIARLLLDQGEEVVVFDRFPIRPGRSVLQEGEKGLTVELGSITDMGTLLEVLRKHKVAGVIHCAGMLPPHANNMHPLEALDVNIMGTAIVLELARQLELSRVVVASAAGVMGRPADFVTPRNEDDVVLPLAGIYPLSKLAAEQLVYTYRKLFGVNATAVRPRNVYGPGCAPRFQPLFEAFFAAIDGKDFVRESGGDSTFDYTFVKDMASGFVKLYRTPDAPKHVYNLSRSKAVSMTNVFEVLRETFPNVRLEVGPGPWEGVVEGGKEFELTVHPAVMPPQDISAARNDFGYNPEWDVEQGIPSWAGWIQTGAN